MRNYRAFLWILGSFLFLFSFWFFYLRTARENRLMKEGNMIVKKIEHFQEKNNRLPNSLNEIGIKEREGVDALYYSKQDSLSNNYMIWFSTSLGESKTYFSDSKKWENRYRKMK